jgi:hypothetical protein
MPRRRTTVDADRDIKALSLSRQGLTYDQIASTMGYRDRSGAFRAVQRGLRDAFREEADELVQMEAERLQALRRLFERIAATPHYAATPSGKIVVHPDTDEPLLDDGPALQAGLALLRVSESWRKLKGLDAPAKSRVEVITEDVVDAEIKRLNAEIAEMDQAGKPGG